MPTICLLYSVTLSIVRRASSTNTSEQMFAKTENPDIPPPVKTLISWRKKNQFLPAFNLSGLRTSSHYNNIIVATTDEQKLFQRIVMRGIHTAQSNLYNEQRTWSEAVLLGHGTRHHHKPNYKTVCSK
jgi:hypothetical protein